MASLHEAGGQKGPLCFAKGFKATQHAGEKADTPEGVSPSEKYKAPAFNTDDVESQKHLQPQYYPVGPGGGPNPQQVFYERPFKPFKRQVSSLLSLRLIRCITNEFRYMIWICRSMQNHSVHSQNHFVPKCPKLQQDRQLCGSFLTCNVPAWLP